MNIKEYFRTLSRKNHFAGAIYKTLSEQRKKRRNQKIIRMAEKAQTHYLEVEKRIRNRGDVPIRFGAYVVFDSTYGADGLFRLMLESPQKWQPKVVIIPDVYRGEKHQKETYKKTKEAFIKKYGAEYIVDGYDMETGRIIDVSDEFDMVYCANPYDSMVSKKHSIQYLSTRDLLVFHISYGFDVGRATTMTRLTDPAGNLLWKYFTDTSYSYQDFLDNQVIKGKNVELIGYAKMDGLSQCSLATNQSRKKILIAPHHTVAMKELPLSNFLKYSELILKLPSLFPDIDFVFRPHPLLMIAMVNNHFWSQEQVDDYLDKIKKCGIEYSYSGDYMDVFAQCDAMINDCGSFTVEWLYTKKPVCFVYNENLSPEHLTTLMNEAIKRETVAYNEKDILDFIKCIQDGTYENPIDDDWLNNNIMINYPNVSKVLLERLSL